MAIIDWPNTDAFKPTLPYSFGVSTPKSGARGFYTGENETVGHLSDRLLVTMNLPPCSGQQAKERSAFLIGAMSNGDRFRFSPWNARFPHGTISGSPTVGAVAAAGARSVTLSGALSGVNLLIGGGFEVDTNADGVSDGWLAYSSGSTGAVTYSRPAGILSPTAQRLDAASLGSAGGDRAGLLGAVVALPGAGNYVLALDALGSSGLNMTLSVDWLNASNAVISSSEITQSVPTTAARVPFALTAPALTAKVQAYLWMTRASGTAAASVILDNLQMEPGTVATSFAGSPTVAGGDLLAVGGNLLMVGYAGATLNDTGAGSVPLALPLLRPLTVGQAITLANPVGTWQIDTTDGIEFDFAANVLQMGVTIPFRQVAV